MELSWGLCLSEQIAVKTLLNQGESFGHNRELEPYLAEEPPFSVLQRLFILLETAGALRLIRGGGTWPIGQSQRERLAREKFALSSMVEQVYEIKGSLRVDQTAAQLKVVREHPFKFPQWTEQLELEERLHSGELNKSYSYAFNLLVSPGGSSTSAAQHAGQEAAHVDSSVERLMAGANRTTLARLSARGAVIDRRDLVVQGRHALTVGDSHSSRWHSPARYGCFTITLVGGENEMFVYEPQARCKRTLRQQWQLNPMEEPAEIIALARTARNLVAHARVCRRAATASWRLGTSSSWTSCIGRQCSPSTGCSR